MQTNRLRFRQFDPLGRKYNQVVKERGDPAIQAILRRADRASITRCAREQIYSSEDAKCHKILFAGIRVEP